MVCCVTIRVLHCMFVRSMIFIEMICLSRTKRTSSFVLKMERVGSLMENCGMHKPPRIGNMIHLDLKVSMRWNSCFFMEVGIGSDP